MDEMLLLEIYVPTAMIYVDIAIPTTFAVSNLKIMLGNFLNCYCEEQFITQHHCALYHEQLQYELVDHMMLLELQICHGDRLILW